MLSEINIRNGPCPCPCPGRPWPQGGASSFYPPLLEPIGANKDSWCIYLYNYTVIGIKVASRSGSVQCRVGSVARFGRFNIGSVAQGRIASRSGRVVRFASRSGSVRVASPAVGMLRSAYCSCCLLLMLLTATAPPSFFFSEFARSVCGAGASQASMTIYRAKLINDLLSTRLQAYRALTHHLEPTYVSG